MLEKEYDQNELIQTIGNLYSDKDNSIFNLHPLGLYLTWLFRNQINIAPNIHFMIEDIVKLGQNKTSDNDLITGIIEILCRVLDWSEDDIDAENQKMIENLGINKINRYYDTIRNILNNERLSPNIRNDNEHIIKSIINNNIIDESMNYSTDFNDLGITVSRVYNITQNSLIVYNLFASIGNKDITTILNKPIDNMIKFLNKYQTFDFN
jgi:hypothetical protein